MGTIVDITIADEIFINAEEQYAAAFDAAFVQIALVHKLMSFHSVDSDLRRINHEAVGSIIDIDFHTYTVLQAATQICDASDGLFDIRIAGPLMDRNMLPRTERAVPSYQPKQEAYRLMPDGHLYKSTADWLDLGGIAKGYAVDLAIRSLQQLGIKNACVNAGGDLRVIGDADTRIALRDPSNPGKVKYGLDLKNQALATSANYFSSAHGLIRNVSALMNGQTGEPILTHISVSVAAASCMVADALTKVIMASGDVKHPCLAQFNARAVII